jgi:hypothetical protein
MAIVGPDISNHFDMVRVLEVNILTGNLFEAGQKCGSGIRIVGGWSIE